jgi:hypothetical protein
VTPIESVNAQLATDQGPSLNVLQHARYVAIVGSRIYPELSRIKVLFEFLDPEAVIVTGGAAGVDQEAERLCGTTRRCAVIRPTGVPRSAGLLARNTVIVRGSDVVVAFWTGTSPGTRDTIEKALLFHGFCIVALPACEAQVWIPR